MHNRAERMIQVDSRVTCNSALYNITAIFLYIIDTSAPNLQLDAFTRVLVYMHDIYE